MAYRFNNNKNTIALQFNIGTDVEGNAITATKSYNLVQDVKEVEDYEETLNDFALAVAEVQQNTMTAIYHNATSQVEESVGGGK